MTATCTASGPDWGCDRPAKSRGLCTAHYNQLQRRGAVKPIAPPRWMPGDDLLGGTPCPVTVDGWTCGRPVSAAGLCQTHRRQQQAGKPFARIGRVRKTCTAAGDGWACKEGAHKQGMCQRHAYQRDNGMDLLPPGVTADRWARRERKATAPKRRNKPAKVSQQVSSPSEPYIPGTLDHRVRDRSTGATDVDTVAHVDSVPPVPRETLTRALGALLAAAPGATREEALELAAMLADDPRRDWAEEAA